MPAPLPQRRLHSEIKRQICLEGFIYKNIRIETSTKHSIGLLPAASALAPLSLVYVCVHKDIWNFEFIFGSAGLPGHLLDVVLKGAVLAVLLIYSANRSVFKVNTFTAAWQPARTCL